MEINSLLVLRFGEGVVNSFVENPGLVVDRLFQGRCCDRFSKHFTTLHGFDLRQHFLDG
jgi:hypothetical protein